MSDRNIALLNHSYVLAELIALAIVRRLPQAMVIDYTILLMNSASVEVVWVDEALHRAATALLLARPDKIYLLCDAVSFVLMRKREIQNALTTDRHFEQEGFHRLLKV